MSSLPKPEAPTGPGRAGADSPPDQRPPRASAAHTEAPQCLECGHPATAHVRACSGHPSCPARPCCSPAPRRRWGDRRATSPLGPGELQVGFRGTFCRPHSPQGKPQRADGPDPPRGAGRGLLTPGPTSGLCSPAAPGAPWRSSRHLARCWHMWAVAARVRRSWWVSSARERHRTWLAARARSFSATLLRSRATSFSRSSPGWLRRCCASRSFSSSRSESLSIS